MNATPSTVLRGPVVSLRLPGTSDLEPLFKILSEPEVLQWWSGYSRGRIQLELIDNLETTRIIEVEGACVGALLVIRGDDPEFPTTVMHIFLSTRYRGRRIGEETLALAIRQEFSDGVTRVTLDPNVHNVAAIRSYERLGFQRIGVLRDYQVRPDGSLNDALFMDLTRSDFPGGPSLPQRD